MGHQTPALRAQSTSRRTDRRARGLGGLEALRHDFVVGRVAVPPVADIWICKPIVFGQCIVAQIQKIR